MTDLTFYLLLCLSIAGVGLTGYGLWLFARQGLRNLRAARWPTVEGQVIRNELLIHPATTAEGSTTYSLDFAYRYTVAGQEYTSSRRFYGDSTHHNFEKPYRRYAERYPPGATITVYHAPNDPTTALTQPQFHWIENGAVPGLLVLVGLAFALGGVLLLTR